MSFPRILALASTGYSGLVHRYAFDGTADDSVDYAHGTLVTSTGAAAYADGLGKPLRRITLDPTNSSNDPANWRAVVPLQ